MCWNAILVALVTMINKYIAFLGLLVEQLCAWPMNLIAVGGLAVALHGIVRILDVILGHLFPWSERNAAVLELPV